MSQLLGGSHFQPAIGFYRIQCFLFLKRKRQFEFAGFRVLIYGPILRVPILILSDKICLIFLSWCFAVYIQCGRTAKGLIWATTEDLMKNRGKVLSLYGQMLRSLNSPNLPLTFAARMAKKAEVRAIFLVASEERSLHNTADLIDAAEYFLSLLRKGEIPMHIQ